MYIGGNEGLNKYDQEVYEHFMDVCDSLPLASVINNKFFAVHGGISPEQLEMVKRVLFRNWI